MIIIDTNILSEEMKPTPATQVHEWFLKQNTDDLYLTAVCEAEILSGIAILPGGRRKQALEIAAEKIFALFSSCILPFDSLAAHAYAAIIAKSRKAGRPINEGLCPCDPTKGLALWKPILEQGFGDCSPTLCA